MNEGEAFQDSIDKLYGLSRYKEAEELVLGKYPGLKNAPIGVLKRYGWIKYKLYDKDGAKKAFQMALDIDPLDPNANAGLAQIAAAEKDEDEVARIEELLPKDDGIFNALAILAADRRSCIPLQKLIDGALCRLEFEGITVSNILKNVGKAIVERSFDKKELILAIGFINTAICRYGVEGALDHRADAWGLLSQAFVKLLNIDAARLAADKSLKLWDEQLAVSSTDKFIEKRAAALKRLSELLVPNKA